MRLATERNLRNRHILVNQTLLANKFVALICHRFFPALIVSQPVNID